MKNRRLPWDIKVSCGQGKRGWKRGANGRWVTGNPGRGKNQFPRSPLSGPERFRGRFNYAMRRDLRALGILLVSLLKTSLGAPFVPFPPHRATPRRRFLRSPSGIPLSLLPLPSSFFLPSLSNPRTRFFPQAKLTNDFLHRFLTFCRATAHKAAQTGEGESKRGKFSNYVFPGIVFPAWLL